MAGHNKWSKIKHKKAVTDARKSRIFSKLALLIQNEAKKCNGDMTSPGLRAAIAKAKRENMPNENIQRAINKAKTAKELTSVIFEAYGPGGTAIIITALTDNNNRTSSEIKHILSKNNASLGAPGSAAWNFTKNPETNDWQPNTTISLSEEHLNQLEKLINALEENDDVQDIYTNAEQLQRQN